MGKPLPSTLELISANEKIGDIILDKEVARDGTSSPSSSPESTYQDDPLLPKSSLSPVDCELIEVYGDTLHDNDGSHLCSGI
eukprot:12003318-Ditylum_brightwellii.AAC.1